MDTIWLPEIGRYTGAKYLRLVQALRAGIQAGNLEPGDKLPPVRDMAWRIGITPGTVARAYSILTQDGTLFAEVGRGTFVATQSQTEASDPPPIEIEPVPHGSDVSEGPISLFSPALPNVGQANLICQLFEQIVADPPSCVMHYPTRVASKPAREAVVNWLKPAALGPVDVEDIVLCHGGQNGIGLILQTLLN